MMESLAFQRLHVVPIPPVHFPVILDRVDLLSFNLRQNLDSHSSSDSVSVNNELAIVPFQPSLHAVLLQIWAASQTSQSSGSLALDSQDDGSIAMDSHDDSSALFHSGQEEPIKEMLVAPEVEPISEAQAPAKKCLSPLLDAVASSAASSLPPRPAGKVSLPSLISKENQGSHSVLWAAGEVRGSTILKVSSMSSLRIHLTKEEDVRTK